MDRRPAGDGTEPVIERLLTEEELTAIDQCCDWGADFRCDEVYRLFVHARLLAERVKELETELDLASLVVEMARPLVEVERALSYDPVQLDHVLRALDAWRKGKASA